MLRGALCQKFTSQIAASVVRNLSIGHQLKSSPDFAGSRAPTFFDGFQIRGGRFGSVDLDQLGNLLQAETLTDSPFVDWVRCRLRCIHAQDVQPKVTLVNIKRNLKLRPSWQLPVTYGSFVGA